MGIQNIHEPAPSKTVSPVRAGGPAEFPVREYIEAMAHELAQMARHDGDEALGRLLDSAVALAGEPVARRAAGGLEARQA